MDILSPANRTKRFKVKKAAGLTLILSLCMVMTAVMSWAGPTEEGWKKVRDRDGIQVYTRPVKGSLLDEFLGVADIPAPLEVVQEVWLDFPSYPQWFGSCREYRLIKTVSAAPPHYLVYYVAASPSWAAGVSDRDAVLEITAEDLRTKERKVVIHLKAVKEPIIPLNPNYVRITQLSGRIILTGINEKATRVAYQMHYDPGGKLPYRVVQSTIVNRPVETITGLRRMVKKEAYQRRVGLNN
jgi:hypothetical protein